MNTIRFIYFDVGGTLLDWSRVFETAALKFNLKAGDISNVFNENVESITKGFLSTKQFWEKCIQKYHIKKAEEYDFLASWVSDYRPIQEIHEFIAEIQSKYKIGLLSNIYEGMLPLLLKKELIPHIHYEHIVFSCDVGMMKPEADMYALAQKKAQIDPKNILLVDDRQDFLDGAKKMQWNTFLFNNKERTRSVNELEEYLKHS